MDQDRRSELLALAGELRPDLHRYCARLMGWHRQVKPALELKKAIF
jgi:hypothetical protein